ncbi:MAG: site-2 protease family protein [bacterium]
MMGMEELSLVQQLVVFLLPLVFAITVHEAAHGWVADRLGDPTARQLGRITLNPIPHIDPIGTIVVPLGLYALSAMSGGGFLFGWAKPVPVNTLRLRNIRRDSALVSIAGPASNLLMLILWVLLMKVSASIANPSISTPLFYLAASGVWINSLLMLLNLLPILPLDGGRVTASLLPPALAIKYSKLEPFGLFILIGLLFTGLLGPILWPAMRTVLSLALNLAGIS